MDQRDWKKMLGDFKAGAVSEEEVLLKLREAPFEDLGYAKVDFHRGIRQGVPEVIYGAGKTPEEILGIVNADLKEGQETILITRMTPESADFLKTRDVELSYHPVSRTGLVGRFPEPDGKGKIAVVTGGTSDLPVAEEAAVTARALGNEVIRMYDVGVSGIHRLLSKLDELMSARVVITIAGMEGALTSVVGGLVDVPVIAVPTSVGYGASFHGLAALLSMLNSCASGVSVVNIDNGFGAAYQASLINHL